MKNSLAGAGCDVRDREMAQALRQAGYRLTQPRLAVLRVLESSVEELSPLGIYERGRAIYDRLGLVTVYRTSISLPSNACAGVTTSLTTRSAKGQGFTYSS